MDTGEMNCGCTAVTTRASAQPTHGRASWVVHLNDTPENVQRRHTVSHWVATLAQAAAWLVPTSVWASEPQWHQDCSCVFFNGV